MARKKKQQAREMDEFSKSYYSAKEASQKESKLDGYSRSYYGLPTQQAGQTIKLPTPSTSVQKNGVQSFTFDDMTKEEQFAVRKKFSANMNVPEFANIAKRYGGESKVEQMYRDRGKQLSSTPALQTPSTAKAPDTVSKGSSFPTMDTLSHWADGILGKAAQQKLSQSPADTGAFRMVSPAEEEAQVQAGTKKNSFAAGANAGYQAGKAAKLNRQIQQATTSDPLMAQYNAMSQDEKDTLEQWWKDSYYEYASPEDVASGYLEKDPRQALEEKYGADNLRKIYENKQNTEATVRAAVKRQERENQDAKIISQNMEKWNQLSKAEQESLLFWRDYMVEDPNAVKTHDAAAAKLGDDWQKVVAIAQRDYNKKVYQTKVESSKSYADDHHVGAFAGARGLNLLSTAASPFEMLSDAMDSILGPDTGLSTADPYTGTSLLRGMADAMDQSNVEAIDLATRGEGTWNKVANYAAVHGYNAVSQAADNVLRNVALGPAGLALMGTDSFNRAWDDAAESGIDPGRAFVVSSIKGLAEVGTEKIPFDSAMKSLQGKSTMRDLLIGFFGEVAGEELSELIGDTAEEVVLGNDSERRRQIEELYLSSNGKLSRADAEKIVNQDFAQKYLDIATETILSSAISEGGQYAIGRAMNRQRDNMTQEERDAINHIMTPAEEEAAIQAAQQEDAARADETWQQEALKAAAQAQVEQDMAELAERTQQRERPAERSQEARAAATSMVSPAEEEAQVRSSSEIPNNSTNSNSQRSEEKQKAIQEQTAQSVKESIQAGIQGLRLSKDVARPEIENGYNPANGLTADEYAMGVREAYRFGQNGMFNDSQSQDTYSGQLPQRVRVAAYNAGRMAKGEAIRTETAKIRTGKIFQAKDTGMLHFDGDTSTFTAAQKTNFETVGRVAQILGKDIYVFTSTEEERANGKPNGWYDPDGTVHIDLNSGADGKGTMLYTAAHELTHDMKATAPGQFQALQNFLFQEYGKRGQSVDQLVKTQMEKMQSLDDFKELSYDQQYDAALEEVVARSMEDMLTHEDALQKLSQLRNENPTLVQRIWDYVKNLASRIREAYKGLTPDSYEGRKVKEMVDAMDQLENLFTQGLDAAARNREAAQRNGQKNTTREGGKKYSPRMDVDESDESRYEKLKDSTITVPKYQGDAYSGITLDHLDSLKNVKKNDAKKVLRSLGERFQVFKQYSNADVDFEFNFSKRNLEESVSKLHTDDYSNYARFLSIADQVISGAQEIEEHSDKTSDPNSKIKATHVLFGAFESDGIVPVKLEVREFTDKTNPILRVAVTLGEVIDGADNKNEAAIFARITEPSGSVHVPYAASNIMLQQLVSKVNIEDGNMLKYFPDQMLDSERLAVKRSEEEKDRRHFDNKDKRHGWGSAILISRLAQQGVPVVTYEAGNETDRLAKLNSIEGAKFQRREQLSPKEVKARAEQKKLVDEDTENLKKLISLQKSTSGKIVITDSSVRELSKILLKKFGAKGNSLELAPMISDAFDYISKGRNLTIEGINERLDDAAEYVINHLKQEQDPYASDILNQMKGAHVALNAQQLQEANSLFGSLRDFRRSVAGTIVMDSKGISLDSWWQDMSSQFPDIFDSEVNANDMPGELANIVETLRSMQTDATDEFGYAAVKQDILQSMYDGYWNVSTLYMDSEKVGKNVKDLKSQHTKMAEEIDHLKKQIELEQVFKNGDIKALKEDQKRKLQEKQREIDEKKQELKEVKELLKMQGKVTGGVIMDKTSVKRKANALLEKYNIADNSGKLANLLNSAYNFIAKGNELTDKDGNVKGLTTVGDNSQEYVYTDQMTIDDVYAQLEPAVEYIMERVDRTENSVTLGGPGQPVISYGFDEEAIRNEVTQDVYDGYWDVSALHTVADKYEKEITQLQIDIDKLNESHTAEIKRLEEAKEDADKEHKQAMLKQQKDLTQKFREQKARNKEGREKTAVRHSIQNRVKTLNQLLFTNSADKHIPDALKKPVAEALDIVDMDNGQLWRNKAKQEQILEKLKNRGLDDLDREALEGQLEKLRSKEGNIKDSLARMKDAYAAIADSENESLKAIYDSDIADYMVRVVNQVGETRLQDMSLEQLKLVNDMYGMVLHKVRQGNKMLTEGLKADRTETAKALHGELQPLDKGKGTEGGLRRMFSKEYWNNLKPEYAFMKMTPVLQKMYRNLQSGQEKWARISQEAKDVYSQAAEKWGFKRWDFKKQHEFEAVDGDKFHLNLQQIMSLYAYAKRGEQARNHIRKGGIVIDQNTDVGRGKMTKGAHSYSISDETLTEIISTLTPEQVKFVDQTQAFLSGPLAKYGNAVSQALYGIDLFGEENYFPLKSAKSQQSLEKAQGNDVSPRIKNSGFAKALTPEASNAIVLSEYSTTWGNHVEEMARYASLTLAEEDFYKILSYGWQDENGQNRGSIQTDIINAFGQAGMDYINTLLKDLGGGMKADPREAFAGGMTKRMKAAAVGTNLSVVVKQYGAVLRASAYIDLKYFAGKSAGHAMEDGKRMKTWEELKKYAPVAIIKEMGAFDVGMGRTGASWVTSLDKVGVKEKVMGLVTDADYRDDVIGILPGKMDELGWSTIWEAAKREVADRTGLTGEAMLEAAGKRFTEVVNLTQVYDSTFSRSANMRSKSGLVKMATAFMAEPTVNLNMMLHAVDLWKQGKRTQAARQLGSVYLASIATAVMAGVVGAGRDDDDDKTFLEKYLGAVIGNIASDGNPLNWIPYVKDVMSLLQGYSVERTDMTISKKIVQAFQAMTKETKSPEEKILGMAGALSDLFFIPLNNVIRDMKMIQNIMNSTPMEKETWRGIWYAVEDQLPGLAKSKNEKLLDTMQDRDDLYLERMEDSYKTDSSFNTAVKEAIKAGFEDGNITSEEATALLKQYHNKPDDAKKTVREWTAKVETGIDFDDIKNQYKDGQIDRQTAVSMYSKYGGKTSKEAKTKVQCWEFQVKYPDYDWADATITKYYNEAKPAGISVKVYDKYLKNTKGKKKRDEILPIINNLPISNAQKDALYRVSGFAESTLKDAPWH